MQSINRQVLDSVAHVRLIPELNSAALRPAPSGGANGLVAADSERHFIIACGGCGDIDDRLILSERLRFGEASFAGADAAEDKCDGGCWHVWILQRVPVSACGLQRAKPVLHRCPCCLRRGCAAGGHHYIAYGIHAVLSSTYTVTARFLALYGAWSACSRRFLILPI